MYSEELKKEIYNFFQLDKKQDVLDLYKKQNNSEVKLDMATTVLGEIAESLETGEGLKEHLKKFSDRVFTSEEIVKAFENDNLDKLYNVAKRRIKAKELYNKCEIECETKSK